MKNLGDGDYPGKTNACKGLCVDHAPCIAVVVTMSGRSYHCSLLFDASAAIPPALSPDKDWNCEHCDAQGTGPPASVEAIRVGFDWEECHALVHPPAVAVAPTAAPMMAYDETANTGNGSPPATPSGAPVRPGTPTAAPVENGSMTTAPTTAYPSAATGCVGPRCVIPPTAAPTVAPSTARPAAPPSAAPQAVPPATMSAPVTAAPTAKCTGWCNVGSGRCVDAQGRGYNEGLNFTPTNITAIWWGFLQPAMPDFVGWTWAGPK
eukprot:gene42542-34249_t